MKKTTLCHTFTTILRIPAVLIILEILACTIPNISLSNSTFRFQLFRSMHCQPFCNAGLVCWRKRLVIRALSNLGMGGLTQAAMLDRA
jgi:hypothetical protein